MSLFIMTKSAEPLGNAIQETPQHCVAETSSASGDQEDFVFENGHNLLCVMIYRILQLYAPLAVGRILPSSEILRKRLLARSLSALHGWLFAQKLVSETRPASITGKGGIRTCLYLWILIVCSTFCTAAYHISLQLLRESLA